MLKRTLIFILISLLIFSLAGCKSAAPEKTDPAPSETKATDPIPVETTAPENPINIVDKNGVVIGTTDRRGAFTATDAGLFYSIWQPGENEKTATAEFHFFRAEDRKDILLGTLPEQGYEAFYARTELGGIVYAVAVTGDPMDDDPDTLWLLAFDPMKETMSQYKVSEHGFPYAALTAVNGKLWIMNHEMDAQKADKIYEFDPGTGKIKEVLSYDGRLEGEGSLRGIYADENTFYVLKLVNPGSGNDLVLDSYDMEYHQIGKRALGDLIIPAGLNVHGMTGESDVRNEFGMMVSRFAVLDGRYLFYENFAILRAVVDLGTDVALFAGEDLYSLSNGGGQPALYRLIFSDEELELSEILTLREGKLEKFAFTAPEGPAFVQNISRSPSGNWLVVLADSSDAVLCFFNEK